MFGDDEDEYGDYYDEEYGDYDEEDYGDYGDEDANADDKDDLPPFKMSKVGKDEVHTC